MLRRGAFDYTSDEKPS